MKLQDNDPMLIWHAILDGKYLIQVVRKDESEATLFIYQGEIMRFQQDVVLAYGAKFGPDVDDIAAWQDIAVMFIDT